ncbi:MAG: universal stress protein [Kofleriaceae bacterium]
MTGRGIAGGTRDAPRSFMWFKKILVAVDFSLPAHDALQVAASMAADSGAVLHLLHAWSPGVYGVYGIEGFPGGVINEVMDDVRNGLLTWKRDAEQLGATIVTTAVRTGAPWHEIVETVRSDVSFDLVVVGTHGRTGLKHVLLGSVAEKVVRHSPCPVLVVRKRD